MTTTSNLDSGVHGAATLPLSALPEPTAAQLAAGSYQMGAGLDVTVKFPEGSVRKSVAKDGTAFNDRLWSGSTPIRPRGSSPDLSSTNASFRQLGKNVEPTCSSRCNLPTSRYFRCPQ